MDDKIQQYRYGLRDGVPIGLGYLAVSFTFGIMAGQAGIGVLAAVIMSLTNLTSAGQFAALGVIQSGAPFMEMAAVQFIINLRYCLMSCSLSQKMAPDMPFFHRFLISYGVTDEVFGVSACREGVLSPYYAYGLISVAVPGWTFGTLLGAVSGDLLPARLLSALSVALYGMFLAIVIPPARGSRVLAGVVAVSMAASFLFSVIPLLGGVTSGFKVIILTVLIAGGAAYFFPVEDEQRGGAG